MTRKKHERIYMKLIDKAKEKRVNAILYFCKNTNKKQLYQTKIFKLLYFLDFLHFKEVGRPVTDLEYYAWDYGPVPTKLFFELRDNTVPEELQRTYFIEKDEDTGKQKIKFSCSKSPNLDVFSDREIKILEKVAYFFKDTPSIKISEISHLKNEPWDRTLKTKGEKQKIDFLLAIDGEAKIDIDTATERLRQSQEMRELFGREQ